MYALSQDKDCTWIHQILKKYYTKSFSLAWLTKFCELLTYETGLKVLIKSIHTVYKSAIQRNTQVQAFQKYSQKIDYYLNSFVMKNKSLIT